MKKILLFLFMCVSSFLIYDNCSALEVSEVNDNNIIEYIEEKYSDYVKEYSFLFKTSTEYLYISGNNPFYFIFNDSKATIKVINPSVDVNYALLSLSLSDLSKGSSYTSLTARAGKTTAMMITYYDRTGFYYSNFDIYGITSDMIVSDTLLYSKNYPIEVEPSPSPSPSPSPTPEPSAPSEEEGGVSANDVIKLYMKYFLMALPVGLIMVSIEKFTEIFHNFILGKMRK